MLTATSLLLALSAGAGLVTAQNYSTTGPLNVTASQISFALRETWCTSQKVVCREACGGLAFPNNCDPTNLSYQCVCTNHANPNISSYSQSLPFFLCGAWIGNCVDNHPNDLQAITNCRSVTCGQKNASKVPQTGGGGPVSASGSSSASSAAATGGSSPTGTMSSASSSSTSTSSSAGLAAATHLAQNYGTHLLAGGMLAVFGLAL